MTTTTPITTDRPLGEITTEESVHTETGPDGRTWHVCRTPWGELVLAREEPGGWLDGVARALPDDPDAWGRVIAEVASVDFDIENGVDR
ncbi:MAG: hypothetical protein AAGA90_20480 [Actinomycetota bacterium]